MTMALLPIRAARRLACWRALRLDVVSASHRALHRALQRAFIARRAGVAAAALCSVLAHAQQQAQDDASACARWAPADAVQQLSAWRSRGAVCGVHGRFGPAGSVGWNPLLDSLAREQAGWLAGYGMLIHTGRSGATLSQRAAATGYRYARIAENLAHGQADVAETLAAWQASDGHCANLFDPQVSEVALACAPDRDGRPMWVLILGRQLR